MVNIWLQYEGYFGEYFPTNFNAEYPKFLFLFIIYKGEKRVLHGNETSSHLLFQHLRIRNETMDFNRAAEMHLIHT